MPPDPALGTATEEPGSPVAPPTAPARGARSRVRSTAALEGEDLRIRLSPELHRLLRSQCHPGGWRLEELVTEMLRQGLAARTPSIYAGDRLLASADTCRFWSRNPLDTNLRLRSDRGSFLISTRPDSSGCQQWQRHFTTLGLPDAEREARQMRLIQLQETMASVEDFDPEGWRKDIGPEDFSVMEEMLAEGGGSPARSGP